MKKLFLLATILLVFPVMGAAAQTSGDLLYLKALKARAQSTQQRVTFEPVRAQHFAPYQYGEAGPNEIQKDNPGDEFRFSGFRVGMCLKWRTCLRFALTETYGSDIYRERGGRKTMISRRVRARDGRSLDRPVPYALDGERSGRTKLYYLFNRFFSQ